MTIGFVMSILGPVMILMNCAVMVLCFPGRKGLKFTVTFLALYSAAFFILSSFLGPPVGLNSLLGLLFFPVIIFLFNAKFFQKVFAFFLQYFIVTFLGITPITISNLFAAYGENVKAVILLISLSSLLLIYFLLAFKFGRHFTKSLFEQGSQKEWAVYSLGPSLSCAVMLALLIAPQSAWNIILLALLVFWSLAVLCFAIINTHEKSKQKYEADFARDIITTGREHYKKMNVLYDEIRIMKHDYKFHLKTTLDLLHRGDIEKGSEYLSSLQSQMEEKELSNFCDNPVINSLVTDYVRRCKELNIDISVSISIPGDFSVPNYEMCIVFGNLLENAMEACQKLAANRKIEFVIKPKGKQIASMVRNTFDGNVIMEDDKFVSTKNGQPGGDPSGLGLQSVKAVIQRYGDLFYTNYEKEWFNVFVLWNDNKTG